MKKIAFYYLCCCLGISMLSACDDCSFTSRNRTKVAVKFYRKGNRQPLDIQFVGVKTGAGQSIDGKVNSAIAVARATPLLLPLHPFEDVSKFTFQVNNSVMETIEFRYRRDFAVVSPRCGYDQRISALEVIQSSFDSIGIFKQNLEIDDSLNVRIYLK